MPRRRPAPPAGEAPPLVSLVPLGLVDQVAVTVVAAHLQSLLGLSVAVAPAWPSPEYALLTARRQYNAGPILKALAEADLPGRFHVGVTALDLCLPILTHVFGEAQLGGVAAVVSFFRLEAGPGGGTKAPRPLAYERLAKVALHESGHLLGLAHCRAPNCLMRFSQGLEHLDSLPMGFCDACAYELERIRRALGAPPGPP